MYCGVGLRQTHCIKCICDMLRGFVVFTDSKKLCIAVRGVLLLTSVCKIVFRIYDGALVYRYCICFFCHRSCKLNSVTMYLTHMKGKYIFLTNVWDSNIKIFKVVTLINTIIHNQICTVFSVKKWSDDLTSSSGYKSYVCEVFMFL